MDQCRQSVCNLNFRNEIEKENRPTMKRTLIFVLAVSCCALAQDNGSGNMTYRTVGPQARAVL